MSILGSPILFTLLRSDSTHLERTSTTTVSHPRQDACRLCLEVHADNVDIFGHEAQKQLLAQKVWKHLSVRVTHKDSLPKSICQQCIKEVENFSLFYSKVERVQNTIHSRIPQTPKEPPEEPKSNISELDRSIKIECTPFVDNIKEFSKDVESDYEGNIKPEEVQLKNLDTVESVIAEREEVIIPDIRNDNSDHCCTTGMGQERQCENYSNTNRSDVERDKRCENYTDTNGCDLGNEKHCESYSDTDRFDVGNETVPQNYSDTNRLDIPNEKQCENYSNTTWFDVGNETRCENDSNTNSSDVGSEKQCENYSNSNQSHVGNETQCENDSNTNRPHVGNETQCENDSNTNRSDVGIEKRCENYGNTNRTVVRNEIWCENYSDTNSDAADDTQQSVFPAENSEPDVIFEFSTAEYEDMIMYDLASFYKLSCEQCQNKETYETYELLQKHCLDEHNTKAFVTCCNRRLSAKDSLRKHMRRHLRKNNKPFKCQLCNKQLSYKWSLNIHMLSMHTPVEKLPYKCKKCPKAFVTRSDFARHESLHIEKEEMSTYICEMCGKKYASSGGLHAHKLYQHKQHSLLCHMCPRFFYTPSVLQKHLLSHEPHKVDEREQCKKCGKTLKNKDTMRSHMKLHEENPEIFPCSQCERTFKIESRLKAHQRSHSNKRPHKCGICNKSFKKKCVLKEHMTQHTGERPHQCPHCPRTFACRSNFYTHKRKMHPSSDSPAETKPEINPNLYH